MNQQLNPLAEPATDTARRYLCRHIHTLGHRCHSPALTGAELCYHHTRARRQAPMAGNTGTYSMPRIDDRTAIQLALYDLLSRIAGGDIDLRRAAILLKGLQTASLNLSRRIPASPADPAADTAASDAAVSDTAVRNTAVRNTAATPPQPEQVEQFTHHPHLGDLAPIQPIPTQAEAAAAAAAAAKQAAAEAIAAAQAASAPKPEVPLFSGIFAINKPPTDAQSAAPPAATLRHSERSEVLQIQAAATTGADTVAGINLPFFCNPLPIVPDSFAQFASFPITSATDFGHWSDLDVALTDRSEEQQ